jgi:replicative DNA helicase
MRAMCQPDQLNIPCIGTAQLSRASANGATGRLRPYQLSDLRESGSYEQDATIVLFIHRPWVFSAPADHEVRRLQENVDSSTGQLHQEWLVEPVFLNVAKARNGGVGSTRKLLWRRYSGRFEEDDRVETL